MAGLPPTQQQQQNPNQPNPAQNPYAPTNTGQTGSGAALTQPSYVNLGQFSPQQTLQYLQQGFAPQDASATNNLNSTLADFGINGGQAVGAMSELQAQLAGAQAPTLANAIEGSQANLLQGGEFNSGAFNNAQQQQLQDQLGLYGMNLGDVASIIGSGQGAGNANAYQYGATVTQTPNPFMSIFQGLMGGAEGLGNVYSDFFGGGGGSGGGGGGSNPYASPM
jgi:hypothetical protein